MGLQHTSTPSIPPYLVWIGNCNSRVVLHVQFSKLDQVQQTQCWTDGWCGQHELDQSSVGGGGWRAHIGCQPSHIGCQHHQSWQLAGCVEMQQSSHCCAWTSLCRGFCLLHVVSSFIQTYINKLVQALEDLHAIIFSWKQPLERGDSEQGSSVVGWDAKSWSELISWSREYHPPYKLPPAPWVKKSTSVTQLSAPFPLWHKQQLELQTI